MGDSVLLIRLTMKERSKVTEEKRKPCTRCGLDYGFITDCREDGTEYEFCHNCGIPVEEGEGA